MAKQSGRQSQPFEDRARRMEDDSEFPHPLIEGISLQLQEVVNIVHEMQHRQERLHASVFGSVDLPPEGPVPPGQMFVVKLLCSHSPINQTELANKLYVERAAMTTMLQRMEKSGLVTRKRDETDQRVVMVNVTPLGRSYAEQIDHKLMEMTTRTYGVWDDEERETVVTLLKKLFVAQDALIQEWQGVKETND